MTIGSYVFFYLSAMGRNFTSFSFSTTVEFTVVGSDFLKKVLFCVKVSKMASNYQIKFPNATGVFRNPFWNFLDT